MRQKKIKLKIILPSKIFLEREVDKLVVEGINGYHGVFPRHIDFVSILVPGILTISNNGNDEFYASDSGVLVKCKGKVVISIRNIIKGPALENLKNILNEKYKKIGEQERTLRSSLAKLESDFVRKLLEKRKPY